MALARYQRTIVDQSGNIIPNATVFVRNQVTGALAPIFSDRDGLVAIDNPITTGADGFAAFHAAGGAYRIVAVSNGFNQEHSWQALGTAGEMDLEGIRAEISSLVALGEYKPYETLAALNADGAYTGDAAIVWGDTHDLSGVYVDVSGTWTRISPWPPGGQEFILAANPGAGTANAIIATTPVPVPATAGAAQIVLPVFITNTASPVTVTFNGGSSLTIVTGSGNNVPIGGLIGGRLYAGYIDGSEFQLISDISGTAIQAAAEAAEAAAAASAAAAAEDAIETAADRAFVESKVDQATLAAIAAGAPIVTALTTDPIPANGTIEILQTAAGSRVYKVQAGAWVAIGWLGEVLFDDVAALLASTLTGFTTGHIIRTRKEGFAYEVVTTGEHVTTAGAVKLKSLSNDVLAFGADPTGVADSTAIFNAALGAFSFVSVSEGDYRINGTIVMPIGSTLWSPSHQALYYPTLAATAKTGVRLFKDSASMNGPIIDRDMSTGLHGFYLEHLKAGGALDGIMRYRGDVTITNCSTSHVYITGVRTASVDLDPETGNAGFGIKFVHCPSTSSPSFFNMHNEIYITDCDVGIFLGQLCNANRFTGYNIRNCHIEIDIYGNDPDTVYAGKAIENVFNGGGHFAIGIITPRPVAFRLKDAVKNAFVGYSYESYGKEFEIDEATCTDNMFVGTVNAAFPSVASGQLNLRHMQPDNYHMKTRMPLITSPGADDRNTFVGGGTFKQIFSIEGDMPQQNNNTGTFEAADADSKVIFRFPTRFTKTSKLSFFGKLRVFAYGAFGNGTGMVEVEFGYSMRNQTTSAGEFSVFSVKQIGNEITGLYFLTGVAAAQPMGVGFVGGNYGAFAFSWIRCELEIMVTDILSTEAAMAGYLNLSSITTAAATADDVTDAITMLTVAETAV